MIAWKSEEELVVRMGEIESMCCGLAALCFGTDLQKNQLRASMMCELKSDLESD